MPHELVKRDGAFHLNLHKDQENSVRFVLPNGRTITVTYKKRFSRDEDSILIQQKPDIIVSLEGGGWPPLNLLLDAKYRVKFDKNNQSIGPGDDAINVLHRYRDAILDTTESPMDSRPKRTVIQAAALFPHYDPDNTFERSVFWKSLKKFGIGAIPFLPSEQRYLKAWLESILQSDDWSVAESAISHIAIDKREDWRKAASEGVLIGILSSKMRLND